MPERVRLFGPSLVEQLGPWLEQLGRADQKQLLALTDVVVQETWSLRAALDRVYPEKSAEKKLESFRALRKRLNDVAEEAGLAYELVTDSKRQANGDRLCWFSGPNQDVILGEEFSRSKSEPFVDQIEVKPKGFSSTVDGKRIVRLYVCKDARDSVQTHRLLEDLLPQLRINQRFRFEFWSEDKDLLLGEEKLPRRQQEIEGADVCLALLSPYLLDAADFKKTELPNLQDGLYGPACVPVNLGGLDPERQDLCGFDLLQVFPDLDSTGYPANRKQQQTFAAELAKRIHDRLVRHFDGGIHPDRSFVSSGDLPMVLEKAKGGKMSLTMGGRLQEPEDALTVLKGWVKDTEAFPLFVLLGEYGIGKTTTLRMLTHELLEERKTNPDLPLPIYVDLRDYRGEKQIPTLEELLTTVIQKNTRLEGAKVTAQSLIRQVRRKGAVMLFDGLDERIVHLNPGDAQEFIRNLWSILPDLNRKPGVGVNRGKFLISCRSHYFRDLASQAAMLTGEGREGFRRQEIPAFCLLPFDEGQIRGYLKQLLGDEKRAIEVMAVISKIHNLSDLAKRPYLLHLLTEVIEPLERASASGTTISAAQLYEQVVSSWLSRDEPKHKLNVPHKKLMMEELAAAMWRSEAKQWPVEMLEAWFDRFLLENEVFQSLYGGKDREVLKEDLRTATFVVRPEGEDRDFRFAHTSLQEYFLACYLKRALVEGKAARWAIPVVSIETLDFLGQMMPEAALPRLNELLEAGEIVGGSLAFRYWMRAVECGYPEPSPRQLKLDGGNIEGLSIRGRSLAAPLNLRGAQLAGAKLRGCKFADVDLTGANLHGIEAERVEWLQVVAADANFGNSKLDGAVWKGGVLRSANLRGARLESMSFINVDLRETRLDVQWRRQASSSLEPQVKKGLVVGQARLPGHSIPVTSCAFSVDGARLLSSSYDRTMKVWDAASGACLLTLSGHSGFVLGCAFSPDGARLLSASRDCTLKVWDAASGECLLTLDGHSNAVWDCAFSPDGARLVSASGDRTLKVWDAASGECLLTLNGHFNSIRGCAFSPDGARLVSASDDRTLKVWDSVTGACLITLLGHSSLVRGCAFSPDGARLVSASLDGNLKVWDAATGACLLTLSGHSDHVLGCGFSPDGTRIFSTSVDSTLKVWDTATGSCLLTLSGHWSMVRGCAFSPDGARLLSSSVDSTLKVWDVATGACLLTLAGHSRSVLGCAFSPDGSHLLSASLDGTLKVWDAASGACLETYAHMPDGEWATFDEQRQELKAVSPGAWRHWGWRWWDEETKRLRLLPAEAFGPLPVVYSQAEAVR